MRASLPALGDQTSGKQARQARSEHSPVFTRASRPHIRQANASSSVRPVLRQCVTLSHRTFGKRVPVEALAVFCYPSSPLTRDRQLCETVALEALGISCRRVALADHTWGKLS
jgi:hypothetical protein